MNGLLKGNFKTEKSVSDTVVEPTLEDEFERAALARLGGSITFVARRRVVWDSDSSDQEKRSG